MTDFRKSTVYQIYPRSFYDTNGDGFGDLKGVTAKLDYIKELGVDYIWMTPFFVSPQYDNGYDVEDYYNIDPRYGTMEDFEELSREAQKRGIKLMLDMVFNHTSSNHEWFQKALAGDERYKNYYIFKKGKEDGSAPTNWESKFGGSAWEYVPEIGQYYFHQFLPEQPDLNWENPKVRRAIYDMILWWMDKGVGGFRLDVIDQIAKEPDKRITINGPRLQEYFKELSRETFQKGDLITVGEAWGADTERAKLYSNPDGSEFSMVFQFEHIGLDQKEGGEKWDLAPLPFKKLKKIMAHWQNELYNCGWNSLFWENHDQPRSVSRYADDSAKYHDVSAKMLATCIHMMQGTPYVYQGEELGMCNAYFDQLEDYRDIESLNAYKELTETCGVSHEEMMGYLKRISRDNARTPMQWDDSANAGFTTGTPWIKVNSNYKTVNAKQQTTDPDSVFSYYKELIRLRHENDIIVYGEYELLEPQNEELFIYTRTWNNEQLMVLCNFTDKDVVIPAAVMAQIPADAQILISNHVGNLEAVLRPYEARVYRYNVK